jgi:malonyl-CoA/methylmalonyl-CoA synthetase
MPINLPIIERASNFKNRIALVDKHGRYSYNELLNSASIVASNLLKTKTDLNESRIAFMVPSGFDYVVVLWGIWLTGGVAVPLCISHPLPEIDYVLEDTEAETVIVDPEFQEKIDSLTYKNNLQILPTKTVLGGKIQTLPQIDVNRRAMILYTSGTTSKPKGAVLTHKNIISQITTLVKSWGWSSSDHILHVLPLHHTHGIVNALLCALWSGASCEMLPQFDAKLVWNKFIEGAITLFMAVPTIYVKLIASWEKANTKDQSQMSEACSKLRLMVSGSAALPVGVFRKWEEITGHTLLERYGMTEIGMALSNPLHGERRPGFVGMPLPGVTLRLVDDSGNEIKEKYVAGEIQVKGDNVFKEYWGKPEATKNVFKKDWFCTGDVAIVDKGYYKILGRSSVDIIKTGGYKVSALEIEEILRTHPDIKECAIVGIEDIEWGEIVSAAIVTNSGNFLSIDELREWAKEKMASYKIPRKILFFDDLPRNVMGKVNKPQVKLLF